MKFVLASQNVHKQRELQAVLAPYGVELLLQRDLGVPIDVDETGATFAENARLKADAALRATGLAAIADDSGLMVDALGGAPGVYSARYGAPACKTDADRNEKLLAALQGVPDEARTARFVCALCCALPDGRRIEAVGTCPGERGRFSSLRPAGQTSCPGTGCKTAGRSQSPRRRAGPG